MGAERLKNIHLKNEIRGTKREREKEREQGRGEREGEIYIYNIDISK